MGIVIPTPGRIVEYTLASGDVQRINAQRSVTTFAGSAPDYNFVNEGDTYPMVIVRVWGWGAGSAINGQVLLDGNDTLWVTSRVQGDGPFHWRPYERDATVL